jgi:hypothetical protein
MRISINSEEVLEAEVSYNDGLNYGRFDSREILPYEYSIDKEEFISLMADVYQECLEEMKLDDTKYNEESAFRKMNYTEIDGAFDRPEGFAEAIETFFDRQLFEKTLGMARTRKYILNSTDKVEVSNETIKIIGRCFPCK